MKVKGWEGDNRFFILVLNGEGGWTYYHISKDFAAYFRASLDSSVDPGKYAELSDVVRILPEDEAIEILTITTLLGEEL